MPPQVVGSRSLLRESRGMLFPALIVLSVLALVTPLPPELMDMLLAANLTASVLILLTTVYVGRPLEFSSFPALLLGTTLARLVLNVASTRLVLTRGATDGTQAAGQVIEAFSQFVAGDQLVVGIVVFLIIIAIQFLVITAGATRISEVAARFALDGLPGKQMAIDADLNSGAITHDEARQRRDDLIRLADFYAAMDGASKFVRGDALASLVILAVNILGGLWVGIFDNGLPIGEAADIFTRLTIGDGLVSQIPAFLISLAAGLIVTRSSGESDLRSDVIGQTVRHPQALFLGAAFLGAMSFTGLPAMPLWTMAAGCVAAGIFLSRDKAAAAQATATTLASENKTAQPTIEDHLRVDPLELTIGRGLVELAQTGDLLSRVSELRTRIAQELGLMLPKMKIKDDQQIDSRGYQLKIRGLPVAWGELPTDRLLAVHTPLVTSELSGTGTTEPASGRPAFWIESSQRERAELAGYWIKDAATVLFSHLCEVVRGHAAELLTRQQLHQLLEHLRQTSPKVVEELIPGLLRPTQVHGVLENLLRERVPIRDLETIMEALAEHAAQTQNTVLLTEFVRAALARTISQRLRDERRVLRVITLEPDLEDIITAGVNFSETGLLVKLSLPTCDAIRRELAQAVRSVAVNGHSPIVLTTSPAARLGLRHIAGSQFPKLTVLSLNDISRDTQAEAIGHVSLGQLSESSNLRRAVSPELAGREP